MSMLDREPLTIAVVGASGAIGYQFVTQLSSQCSKACIYAFSRRSAVKFGDCRVVSSLIDIESEQSIEKAVATIPQSVRFDLIIIATGMLHSDNIKPEKSLNDLSILSMQKIFNVNTFGPALLAKYFTPRLVSGKISACIFLSARVSSISDNRLGGWYSYRASKTALNMIVKTLSIELRRKFRHSVVAGLHPGTVDSRLSKPFQSNLDKSKLFNASESVAQMIKVIANLTPDDSGFLFAYDGSKIAY